jgi:hypothetical protein
VACSVSIFFVCTILFFVPVSPPPPQPPSPLRPPNHTRVSNGTPVSTTLPAAQAVLTAADSVTASMMWAYLRIFGGIWGVAIPAAIFNSRFAVSSTSISDENVRDALGGGNAYSRVSGAFVSSLPEMTQNEVVEVYYGALRVVWYVCLALNVITLAIVFLEKEVVMRTTLDFPEQGNKPPSAQENTQSKTSEV